MEDNSDANVIQMDTVWGQGGKILLTLHFGNTSLMLAFLRDANTSRSVTDIWGLIYHELDHTDFEKLCSVILADNGSEYSNPKAIEFDPEEKARYRTHIFYCDPCSPYQKEAIEVNHEMVRRVVHKGNFFDNYTQEDIFLMMDHINSYKRKKLNNRSPYDAFSVCYGEDILKRLGRKPVVVENIILKLRLFKSNR